MNRTLARTIDRLFIALVLRRRRSLEEGESQCGLEAEAEKRTREPQPFCFSLENQQLKLRISTLAGKYDQSCRYLPGFDQTALQTTI